MVDQLKERIKELSCLYSISTIASKSWDDLDGSLREIIEIIPPAYRFPEKASAKLVLHGQIYTSGEIDAQGIFQKSTIHVDRVYAGYIEVSYAKSDSVFFLDEEQQMLDKIANEIAMLVERYQALEKEKLLHESLRMNDRLNALGEMTASVAHELNTPLGNILGFAQLIRDQTQDSEILKDVSGIIRSARHAGEIVNKLMLFSCEVPFKLKRINANALVRKTVNMLEPVLNKEKVTVNLIANEREQIFLEADEVQLTQVFFNLLTNAIHASSEGQSIDLEIAQNNAHVTFLIRDFGTGIPDEIQDRIFEPFFTSKPVGKGNGLGLSVVHGIVQSHRGLVQYSTEPGRGTTFKIELPIKSGV